jgi:hypothetical protein
VVVVVTGDGDLEEPIREGRRRKQVFVCGLRGAVSPALHPFVKQADGRGVWLDELVSVSGGLVGSPRQASSSSLARGRGGSSGSLPPSGNSNLSLDSLASQATAGSTGP